MLLDIIRVLTLKHKNAGDVVFTSGQTPDFFYFIIKGGVKILTNVYVEIEEQGDENIHKMIRKSLDVGNPKAKRLLQTGPEVEIMTLHNGESFGQAAIVTEKPRYFTAVCTEPCILVCLNRDDYFGLEGTQEKQVNEKLEFLRSLQMFKTWSRVSLYNLTFYFKELRFRRGAEVYCEGDLANTIYIIKEGEFKFTQRFSVNAGNLALVSGKNSKTLKSAKGNTVRFKDLQVVTRQPGEVFGLEEVLDKKPCRMFTCTCLSLTGKLLVISEKNFYKKITHPESIKFYEESFKTFKAWVEPRLQELKKMETFKDDASFTPFQKLKVVKRTSTTSDGDRVRSFSGVNDDNPLPLILKKIIVSRAESAVNTTRNCRVKSMFATELNDLTWHEDRTTGYDFSFKDGPFTPVKLIKTKLRKNKTELK